MGLRQTENIKGGGKKFKHKTISVFCNTPSIQYAASHGGCVNDHLQVQSQLEDDRKELDLQPV